MAPEETEIVDIRFSFDNKKLLKVLESRSRKLNKKRFEKVLKCEEKMDTIIK